MVAQEHPSWHTATVPPAAHIAPDGSAVSAIDLKKTYTVTEREGGAMAALRSLLRREKTDVEAVAGISFHLSSGEIAGFLGPNGARKTTTLKMLSGLLIPRGDTCRSSGTPPRGAKRRFSGRSRW